MSLFRSGVVLPFQKGEAPRRPVEDFPLTPETGVWVTLATDFGREPVSPDVPMGRTVEAGAVLYQAEDAMPIVSPITGIPKEKSVVRHPQYGELSCVHLYPPKTGIEKEPQRLSLPEGEPSAEDILRLAREAAIYDELDGVALWEKFNLWRLTPNEPAAMHCVLIADATENDVYGSAAWAVLREHARQALDGLQLAAKALCFSRYRIATMLPKEDRRRLRRAVGRVNVHIVGDEYPVTDYADAGMDVFRIGIQACVKLAAAVRQGEKSLDTVITVSGDRVPKSRNLRVPYGVTVGDILSYCHADPDSIAVLGDAMTGIPCPDRNTPLLPGVTTVLAMDPRDRRTPQPCIGCGRCSAVCHAGLIPYEIVRRLDNMHYERLQHLAPGDCDGCGACSYVCPASRPVAADVLRAGETSGTVLLQWDADGSDE